MSSADLTNTVDSKDQIKKSFFITDKNLGRPRILFAGNSITRHAPKSDIGWSGDWGMAASSKENDYVHQTMRLLHTIFPKASYAIAQCAEWERSMDCSYLIDAKKYDADIVIILLGDNINEQEHNADELCGEFIKLIRFFGSDKAEVFISKPFMWKKPIVSKAIETAAEQTGAAIMTMDDIGDDIKNRAVGKFEHSGVAAHPGDIGMLEIAKRIFKYIKKYAIHS